MFQGITSLITSPWVLIQLSGEATSQGETGRVYQAHLRSVKGKLCTGLTCKGKMACSIDTQLSLSLILPGAQSQ